MEGPFTWNIKLRGLVQGIGFRPFVHRLALDYGLTGWVRNGPDGVEIGVNGKTEDLDGFCKSLVRQAPTGAVILSVEVEKGLQAVRHPEEPTSFQILPSSEGSVTTALVSPDLAICRDCQRELNDPQDRRYRHPFISCTACGPRFTIIKGLPYDRPKTSMDTFPLCSSCSQEYHHADNRRFHAQPVACRDCGPTLSFSNRPDGNGSGTIHGDAALERAVQLIQAGGILAVKGLGGYHLVCNGRDEACIDRLRQRKHRPHKPLAVMFRDAAALQANCICPDDALSYLSSPVHPILILPRTTQSALPRALSPGLSTIGAMLPYTPLHVLLFAEGLDALVVTSANRSGDPIVFSEEELARNLGGVIDGVLDHSRPIVHPLDDSVALWAPSVNRGEQGATILVRRSRGKAPLPIPSPMVLDQPILGIGSDLKASFCLGRESLCFPSPYLGDLERSATVRRYRRMLTDYLSLFDIQPTQVACDLHPSWIGSQVIARNDWRHLPLTQVQHHHAHIAACMAENQVSATVLGIAYDGTGYGDDQTIWGGEFLLTSLGAYTRVGHWQQVPLPGGDLAIHQPWRMAVAYLKALDIIPSLYPAGLDKKASILLSMWNEAVNAWTATSSVGRLFDAVSALLGLVDEATYDGQAPALLEALAWQGLSITSPEVIPPYDVSVRSESIHWPRFKPVVIPAAGLIGLVLEDLSAGTSKNLIAARFHSTVATVTVEAADLLCRKFAVDTVALSGGVWQNRLLFTWTKHLLEHRGLRVLTHSHLSPGDECIGYGQVMVAAAQLKSNGK